MTFRISFVAAVLAMLSSAVFAEPSIQQMAARAKQSLTSNSSYEMISVQAFWGDASFMQTCAPQGQPAPASFVIYFEVLANGTLGSTIFEPLTETAKCIKKLTAHRTFPKPPSGAYVTKIDMSFRP